MRNLFSSPSRAGFSFLLCALSLLGAGFGYADCSTGVCQDNKTIYVRGYSVSVTGAGPDASIGGKAGKQTFATVGDGSFAVPEDEANKQLLNIKPHEYKRGVWYEVYIDQPQLGDKYAVDVTISFSTCPGFEVEYLDEIPPPPPPPAPDPNNPDAGKPKLVSAVHLTVSRFPELDSNDPPVPTGAFLEHKKLRARICWPLVAGAAGSGGPDTTPGGTVPSDLPPNFLGNGDPGPPAMAGGNVVIPPVTDKPPIVSAGFVLGKDSAGIDRGEISILPSEDPTKISNYSSPPPPAIVHDYTVGLRHYRRIIQPSGSVSNAVDLTELADGLVITFWGAAGPPDELNYLITPNPADNFATRVTVTPIEVPFAPSSDFLLGVGFSAGYQYVTSVKQPGVAAQVEAHWVFHTTPASGTYSSAWATLTDGKKWTCERSIRTNNIRVVEHIEAMITGGSTPASATVTSHETTTYQNFAWGESVIEELRYSDLTHFERTAYTYYDSYDTAVPFNYGKLKLVERPHRDWSCYYRAGHAKNVGGDRIDYEFTPWKDTLVPTNLSLSVLRQNSKTQLTSYDAAGKVTEIRTTLPTGSGFVDSSRTTYDQIIVDGNPAEVTKEFVSATDSFITLNISYPTTSLANLITQGSNPVGFSLNGRPLRTVKLKLNKAVEGTNGVNILHQTVYQYDANFVTDELTIRTIEDPQLPTSRGSLSVSGLRTGRPMKDASFIATNGAAIGADCFLSITTYDANGVATTNGVVSADSLPPVITYVGTDAHELSTDLLGNTKTTVTDGLGRLLSVVETRVGGTGKIDNETLVLAPSSTSTSYQYALRPGGGTITTTTRTIPAYDPQVSIEHSDLLGRVLWSQDFTGRVTTHEYAGTNDPASETTTTGGKTTITTQYADGQVKSVTGTANPAVYYNYVFALHPTTTEPLPYHLRTIAGPSADLPASSPLATSYTVDGSGRTIAETHLWSPNAPAVFAAATTYDDSGRILSASRPAPNGSEIFDVYQYAQGGRFTQQATSLDASWSSADFAQRDSLQEFIYDNASHLWWERITTTHPTIPNGGAGTLTVTDGIRMQALGPFLGNGPNSTTPTLTGISRTIAGGRTTETRQFSEQNGLVARILTTSSTSNHPATQLSINGQLVGQSTITNLGVTKFARDAAGNTTAMTDPRTGETSSFEYYPATGQLYREHRAGSAAGDYDATYTYYTAVDFKQGRIASIKDALNNLTYFDYEELADGALLTRQWGGASYPTETITNRAGHTSELRTFRAPTQSFITSFPANLTADITHWTYHAVTGHLLTKTYAAQLIPGASATESYSYRMDGQIHVRTRPSGATTTYAYTALGQVESVITAGAAPGTFVGYTYEPFSGQLATRLDAAGLHTYNYSATTGLPTGEAVGWSDGSMNLLAGASIAYDYDSQARRMSVSGSYAGQPLPTTSYLYSPLGRLSRVSSQGAQVDYAYVPNSTLVEHRDYRMGATVNPVLTASHRHDARGNLVDVINTRPSTVGSEKISHHYTVDELNRRTVAEREDNTQWTYGYDTRSQVTSAKKSNQAETLLPGAQMEYTYDDIGNRLTSKDGGGSWRQVTYTTNELNQYSLISRDSRKVDFVGTAGQGDTITLNRPNLAPLPADRVGPWWRLEADPAAGALFAYADIRKNGLNIDGGTTPIVPRLAPVYPTTAFTPTHDADGNLTFDGRIYYGWDNEGHLSWAYTPGRGNFGAFFITCFYDAEGRRIAKHVSGYTGANSSWTDLYTDLFLYDGWNLLATYRMDHVAASVNSSLAYPVLRQTFTWGLDVSGTYQGAGGVGGLLMITESETYTAPLNSWETSPTTVVLPHHRFPAYDGNGNVMALISAQTLSNGTTIAGNIDATYEYDPFGRPIRATGPYAQANPFRFSTKFADDETGLVYYGYRYYDAVQGRWLGRDPIEEQGGVNLYGFTNNSTIGFVDSDGRKIITPPNLSVETAPPIATQPPITTAPTPTPPSIPTVRPAQIAPPIIGPMAPPLIVLAALIAWTESYGKLPELPGALVHKVGVTDVDWEWQIKTLKDQHKKVKARTCLCPPLPQGTGWVFYPGIENERGIGAYGIITSGWRPGEAIRVTPSWWSTLPASHEWQRGHLLGKAMGGSGGYENLAAMTVDTNKSAVRTQNETKMESWLRNKKTVCFRIAPTYIQSENLYPFSIGYTAWTNDLTDGIINTAIPQVFTR